MAGILDKKVAFVTGAGGGIGRATCLTMSREGALIAVADRDIKTAEETASEVRSLGGDAFVVTGDVTNEAEVSSMIAAIVSHYGRIDCAFNNAGINSSIAGASGKKTHEVQLKSTEMLLDINVIGVWLCMKYELIQMLAQGFGSIVNTSSGFGLVGQPGSSIYGTTKHAVIGLTKSAALEYADKNIRVNAICPGLIDTSMMSQVPLPVVEELLKQVPLHRMGKPSEIGECVTWLCSDRASYVTGATIVADGGLTTK